MRLIKGDLTRKSWMCGLETAGNAVV